MRHRLPLLLIAFFAAHPLLAAPLMETWEAGYTGSDATGPQVIAYWKFDGDSPEEALRDLSGNGHNLTLQGDGVLSASGKSGGALESFPGFPVQSKRHAAAAPHRPDLSLAGAFTLEMWVAPKAEFEEKLRCYLLDKKYVDHTDYQWQLSEADKGGLRRMSVAMGFGSDSRTFHSEAARYEAGVWRHLAFTYDGAGEGRFFIDGAAAGIQRHEGVAGPVPGNKPISIGDRIGSNYGGFPGLIDEVRICKGVLTFEPVSLAIASPRTVWERQEKAGAIEVTCTNLRRTPIVNASLRLVWSDGGAAELIALPDLPSGGTHVARLPVDTSLRPDEYSFRARLELTEPQPFATEREVTFQIVARKPVRMPVIMWGAGGGEIPRLKELGFTHFSCTMAGSPSYRATAPVPIVTPIRIRSTSCSVLFTRWSNPSARHF